MLIGGVGTVAAGIAGVAAARVLERREVLERRAAQPAIGDEWASPAASAAKRAPRVDRVAVPRRPDVTRLPESETVQPVAEP